MSFEDEMDDDIDDDDVSPLERAVTAAYAVGDVARVKGLLQGGDAPNDLKDTVFLSALRDGKMDLARFVYEDAKVDMSPERLIMILFACCLKQQKEAALYLSEKTAELGLHRCDAYGIILEKFPEDRAQMAEELVARAADKQDARDQMLYAAAGAGAFSLIPGLLDAGARADAEPKTLSLIIGGQKSDIYEDRDKYAGLVRKFLGRFDDAAAVDTALILSCVELGIGRQYPETVQALLDAGADPFMCQQDVGRTLAATFRQRGENDAAEHWQAAFARAQEQDTARHRQAFTAMYGADFTLRDLLQPLGNGETGLMLAAKARLLDRVAEKITHEAAPPLAVADLVKVDARNHSALSFAIDRGDEAQLLRPAYWAKADPGIAAALESHLIPEQQAQVDLRRLGAEIAQCGLRTGAADARQRFRLK